MVINEDELNTDLLERELREGLVLKDIFWLMEDLQYPRDYIIRY